MPERAVLEEFIERHPELREPMQQVINSSNAGLAMLRLRKLAEKHEEVNELLPPKDLDITKLRRFAEDEIESRFERVSGVSQSNVIGGLEDELQVVVDPEKLASREVTIADVRRVLRAQNKDVSAGDFWEQKRRWVVRTLGQFRNIEDVESQILGVHEGAPVFVRDVAEVRIGYKKPTGLVRRFGEASIAINCVRETGANVLDVMDGLRAVRAEVDEKILKPRGLQLLQVYDETEYIYSSVNLVQQNIFIGGALTMVVLMQFLHLNVRTLLLTPFILLTAFAAAYVHPYFFGITLVLILIAGLWYARGALIVGLAIPTSIIGTFLVLGMLGRSLNVISLAGLAFAVGMLVDNAVVVLENVYRHAQLGASRLQAAVRGTYEVSGAVVASTLTTIAVFLPVVFVEEEAGQLFQDIALAISSAVGLSLVISVTLISMSSARLLKTNKNEGEESEANHANPIWEKSSGLAGLIESVASQFSKMIVRLNGYLLHSWFLRFGTIMILVAGAAILSWLLWPKVDYLPNGNRNLVFGILLPPPGYNQDELMELGRTVETELRPYWDVDPGSPEAAALKTPIIYDFFFVARGRSVFMGLRSTDPLRAGELIPLIQKTSAKLPGTFAVAQQSSLFERGLTAGRTIDIEIIGPDLTRLVGLGGQIFGQVMQNIEGVQARPVPSLDLSSPEIHLEPRNLSMAELEMQNEDLGYTVNALIDGAYAGDYFLGGDKIDLTIVGLEQRVQLTQDVAALPVATPGGQLVPLGTLADVSISSGPEQVNHRERQRAITIVVTPPADMPLEDAMDVIQEKILGPIYASGQLGEGYRINLTGTADKLRDTWLSLRFNVALALLITYLLMAALFESWLYPLVIIMSVPLGAVGGVLGLAILNLFVFQALDTLTMLGFVILIGTVVNNPILIVHHSLELMRETGLGHREAILESVRTRIRPIFMTTTTTVLGLLPLVLFPGAGSELYRGLGSVVLGGLVVSTLFTLVLVPVLFSVALEMKQGLARLIWGKPHSIQSDIGREKVLVS